MSQNPEGQDIGGVASYYAPIVENMINACAFHRIIRDQHGNPVDYEFLLVNNTFEQLLNLDGKQIIGKRVTEIIPRIADDEFDWIQNYGSVALSGEGATFEKYSDSLNRWFSIAAFCPEPGYFFTIFADITENVRTEEKLKSTIQELGRINRGYQFLSVRNRIMLKAQSEHLLLEDICRTIVDMGGFSLAWVSYRDKELGNQLTVEMVYGADYGYVEQIIAGSQQSQSDSPLIEALESSETVVVHHAEDEVESWWLKAMSEFGFESSIVLPLKINHKSMGVLNVCSTENDAITAEQVARLKELASDLSYGIKMLRIQKERNKLQKKVEEKSELLGAVIDSTTDGVLVVDAEGSILYYDKQLLKLWRIPEDYMKSANHDDFLRYTKLQFENPELFENETLELTMSSNVKHDTLRLKDGREFERHSRPLLINGRPIGRVWTYTNVTPLVRARHRAELYLDLITHDFRNALQGVRVGVDLLRMESYDTETYHSALNHIECALQKCIRVISKVHQIQDVEDEELSDVRILEIVTNCVENFLKLWSDVDVNVEIPNEDITILADSRLEYLLMNLLENAVEHNPSPKKEVLLRIRKTKHGCELSVADNGPGIDETQREELFDPNRRFGGLGLHIVLELVKRYGGTIDIRDRISGSPRDGSEFVVCFPCAELMNY